jgi:hypothetical protein
MSDEVGNEFMKRGYLLPMGCKNLAAGPFVYQSLPPIAPKPLQHITVPALMKVEELARALNQNPFKIIDDLVKIGVLATASQYLSFGSIFFVAWKYGFVAEKR